MGIPARSWISSTRRILGIGAVGCLLIAAVILFAALHARNDFLGPLLYLQDATKYTLAIGLTFFQSASQYDIQFNLLMAAALLVVAPVVVLFIIFQRAFIEGISFGGSK